MPTLRQNLAQESPQLPLWTTSERLDRRFTEHRQKHPEVYARLVQLARNAKAAGWQKIGIRMLWERIRWERGPKTHDEDGFYLNDQLTSRYVRAIEAENEDLRGMFETRELRSVS